jgi:hypothetical protein
MLLHCYVVMFTGVVMFVMLLCCYVVMLLCCYVVILYVILYDIILYDIVLYPQSLLFYKAYP